MVRVRVSICLPIFFIHLNNVETAHEGLLLLPIDVYHITSNSLMSHIDLFSAEPTREAMGSL